MRGFSTPEVAFLHVSKHLLLSWVGLTLQLSSGQADLTVGSPGLSQHAPGGIWPWGRGHNIQQVTSLG